MTRKLFAGVVMFLVLVVIAGYATTPSYVGATPVVTTPHPGPPGPPGPPVPKPLPIPPRPGPTPFMAGTTPPTPPMPIPPRHPMPIPPRNPSPTPLLIADIAPPIPP